MKKKIFASGAEQRPLSFLTRGLLCAGSGLLMTGSFPDIGASYLAWVSLLPLFISLKGLGFKEGFRCGFFTGMVHYVTLLYWLVPTMVTYGQLPLFLSVPLLVLLSAYLALFTAAFSGIAVYLIRRPISLFPGIPSLWVFLEYLRTVLFTGFPWELFGYSQATRLHLIQISDIFGVYGVSFLILFWNVSLFFICLGFTRRWKVDIRTAATGLVAAGILTALTWGYGELRIREVDAEATKANKSKISVVQGNIEQGLKWDPRYQEASIQKYLALTRTVRTRNPDLIVWPETATPFYFLQDTTLSKIVLEGIRDMKSDFLIGSPAVEKRENRNAHFNSAYCIDASGKCFGRYDKAHLVPYGEYVPLKRWMPFLGKMVEQVGDFQPGEKGRVIDWKGAKAGVLICYELIFPYLSRAHSQNGAQMLINITNDAWYGKTSAPHQHFLMGVFRAVENRLPLVRSANTGISGFIDPVGRVLGETPLFQEAVATREVPMMRKTTLYARFGDWFPLVCLGFAAAALSLCRKING